MERTDRIRALAHTYEPYVDRFEVAQEGTNVRLTIAVGDERLGRLIAMMKSLIAAANAH